MDLEGRGIPGGFVASDVFKEAADAQAKALGFDPMKVFVPHPIQDRTDEEMVEIAFERMPENQIHVTSTLVSPHSLVIKAKKILTERKRLGSYEGAINVRRWECLDIRVGPDSIDPNLVYKTNTVRGRGIGSHGRCSTPETKSILCVAEIVYIEFKWIFMREPTNVRRLTCG